MENADSFKNVYIEQTLLAGMMQRTDYLEACLGRLTENDFCFKNNHVIFQSVKKINNDKEDVSFFSVEDYLQKTEQLEKVGGRGYLWGLVDSLKPNMTSIEANINILRSCTIRRNIADACSKAHQICTFPGERSVAQMLEEVEKEVFSVIQKNRPKTLNTFDIQACFLELAEKLEKMKDTNNNDDIATGFKNLDNLLGPISRGELIIVAGRPSMGKTTFALNIAKEAILANKKVLFFSLEMPKDQITAKVASSIGRFNLQTIFKKEFGSDEDWSNYSLAVSRISDKKFKINDDGTLTVLEMKSCARDVMNEFSGLDLIIIDYLGLIKASNPEANKTEQIGNISNNLKRMARELNVPVLAVCQINRGVEGRPDKRPNMSDLRDSGEIEQDADKILFVYRDYIYNPDANEKEAEIIIRKNRNGVVGTAKLRFEGKYAIFSDWDHQPDDNVYPIGYEPKNKREGRNKNDVL